jgi:hypothetical protein
VRLFCGGTDSYTEGETSLLMGRLVYGGGDSSTEGGGDSSTKGEARPETEICSFSLLLMFVILVLLLTFWCIFVQLFQRILNQREILRFLISF